MTILNHRPAKGMAPAIAGLVLLMSTVAALAANAEARTAVNVRSGPGLGNAIVDSLYAGEDVEVAECTADRSWCYVTHSGPDGWVSSDYLQPLGSGDTSGSGSTGTGGDDCHFNLGPTGFHLECGGSSITVPVPGTAPGTPPSPPSPAPSPTPTPIAGQACFYTGAGYTGEAFCTNTTTINHVAAPFNNRISSVRLASGMRARLCRNANLTGVCATMGTSGNVTASVNNAASSIRVYPAPTPTPTPIPIPAPTPTPAPSPSPIPAPGAGEVCFFKGYNFTGERFCANPTTIHHLSGGFDNRISSVRVGPGMRAKLCKNDNLEGTCRIFTASAGMIGSLNNTVSSVRVYAAGGTPAPTAPIVHVSRMVTLPQTFRLNLDTAAVGAPGADIWYRAVSSTQKYIQPVNGAKLSFAGGARRGWAGCKAATFTNAPIALTHMHTGDYACFKTNDGRVGEFALNAGGGSALNIGFTTWAN